MKTEVIQKKYIDNDSFVVADTQKKHIFFDGFTKKFDNQNGTAIGKEFITGFYLYNRDHKTRKFIETYISLDDIEIMLKRANEFNSTAKEICIKEDY